MRSKKGITLVSLVVTIIVLIILAGVSINLTLGENGIITIAKKARENMELATIEEETKLNALYTQIELENENIGGIDNSSISKLIEFKQKVASAITDMGVKTSEEASADTMSSNIRSIARDASSITYDNTSSGLESTNVQGAVDNLNDSLRVKPISYTLEEGFTVNYDRITAKSYGNVHTFGCQLKGNLSSSGSSIKIATIDANIAPKHYSVVGVLQGEGLSQMGYVQFGNNGELYAYIPPSTSCTQFKFSLTWVN